MSAKEIEQDFPNLKEGVNFELTSIKDYRYNCIAWAGGDSKQWWEPSGWKTHFWLHNDLSYTLESYVKVFNILGYKEESDSSELESDFEKVALFVDADGLPSHAARQKDNGLWMSKLGEDEDIEHNTLESLEGVWYGTLKLILKRPRQEKKEVVTSKNKTSKEFENFKNLAKKIMNSPKKEIENAKEKSKNKKKADK